MSKFKYGLRLSTVRKIEDELSDYPNYDKRLNNLRQEALYPWVPNDANVGGEFVKSNTSRTETAVNNYLCNIKRANILKHKTAIERIINMSSQKEKDFLDVYYFGRKKFGYTCDVIHVSQRTGFRIKKKIISRLAEELGEY